LKDLSSGVIKVSEEKEMNECLEEIEKKKVIPHKTDNILKDIEYDSEVIKKEICENLDE
jgi:hypothetical protein